MNEKTSNTVSTIAFFTLIATVILIILYGCTTPNPATRTNRNGSEFHKVVETSKN